MTEETDFLYGVVFVVVFGFHDVAVGFEQLERDGVAVGRVELEGDGVVGDLRTVGWRCMG